MRSSNQSIRSNTTASPTGRQDVVKTQKEISSDELSEILALVKSITGITMNDSKRQLIMRRLNGRLKALKLGSYREYIDRLKSGDAGESLEFSNAVTTNLTSFFRELHHFEFLTEKILPEIIRKKNTTDKKLRIWSAGCSTGEEPYSIAMTLSNMIRDFNQWDIKILATDIDSNVLQTSKDGKYDLQRVEKIPKKMLHRWFNHSSKNKDGIYTACSELKSLIKFNRLNLMEAWPMKGEFDVVFCRNVIIYFDKATQRTLVDRYADIVADGGYLMLGHSETLLNVSTRFKLIGKTIYRKV